jgi:hypothetical protein
MLSGQPLLEIENGFGKNGDASDGADAKYSREWRSAGSRIPGSGCRMLYTCDFPNTKEI